MTRCPICKTPITSTMLIPMPPSQYKHAFTGWTWATVPPMPETPGNRNPPPAPPFDLLLPRASKKSCKGEYKTDEGVLIRWRHFNVTENGCKLHRIAKWRIAID